MKHIKPVLAAVLAVTIVAAALSLAFPAKAAANGVQKKLDELRAVYDTGTYFTVSGEACWSSQCDDCRLSLIPSRGGLPSGADVCAGCWDSESWSCRAFANYVFHYLFGERYWHLQSSDVPVLGDFVKFNGGRHSAIYLWEDAKNYYVYDSNGDSRNGVCYNRAYAKSGWSLTGIYHATCYDDVMKNGTSVVYHEPENGRYGVYSVVTGLYLGKPAPVEETGKENEAGSALYSLTAAHADVLTALTETTPKGTRVTVAVSETEKTGWLLEAAAGGFVIHSEEEPEKVLTAKDQTVVLDDYRGTAAQIWSFGPTAHRFEEEKLSGSTCAVAGQTLLTCTECGYRCMELQPLEPHVYAVQIIAPEENAYGFMKYKCVNCGDVIRKDVKEKLNPDALIDTGDIVQRDDGFVYVSTNVTDEALFDAFPGYAYSEAKEDDGVRLVPVGAESVPEKSMLTLLLPGDADGDGKVSVMDARAVLRFCVNMEDLPSERAKLAADIDFDGTVSAEDSRWILRTAVGYDTGATTLAGIRLN